jgi:plasmid stabilization system protein ParE
MRLALNISGDANRDLETIADYIGANYGLSSSDRFIAGITARLKQLAQFPLMGPSREEIAPGFRSLNYERYLILTVTLLHLWTSLPSQAVNRGLIYPIAP